MKKNTSQLISCLTAVLFLLPLSAKEVSLTSTNGKTGVFKLQSLNGESIKVLTPKGKSFQIEMSQLDEKSRQTVKHWVAEGGNVSKSVEIEFTSGKRARVSKNEDYDDKAYVFNPAVTITNKSSTQDTPPLKVTIALLGRPVSDSSHISVQWVETKALSTIAPRQKSPLKFHTVDWEYDNRGYAQHGSRYLGYLVTVSTAEGDVIASKATPEKSSGMLIRIAEKLLIGDVFDKYRENVSEGSQYAYEGELYGKGYGPRHKKNSPKGKGKGRFKKK